MSQKPSKKKRKPVKPMRRCGICGSWKKKLTRTECCGNWICDDADEYVPFSYARNSCYRNHDRFTVCAMHHAEGHEGDWENCRECQEEVPTEMYVWYGTNEYNFRVLKNPPSFEATHCSKCGRVIRLAYEGYTMSKGSYICDDCSDMNIPDFTA